MCEPTSLAVAAFTLEAGSAVANHVAQNKASKANRQESERAYRETTRALGLREQQEQAATNQTVQGIEQEGRSAVAMARVSASAAGVSGSSVDALYDDLQRDTATLTQIQRTNLDMTMQQLQAEKRGARAQADSRIAQAPGANPFLTGLQIGAAGLNLAGGLSSRKPAKATADAGPSRTPSTQRKLKTGGQRGPTE